MRIAMCFLVGIVSGWLVGFTPILAAEIWLNLSPETANFLGFTVCMVTGSIGTFIALYRWGHL